MKAAVRFCDIVDAEMMDDMDVIDTEVIDTEVIDTEVIDTEVSDDISLPVEPPVDSGPPPEMGRTPIFADYFKTQNVNGSVLERWSIHEFCSPTMSREVVFCVPRNGGSHITTRFSTLNYQGLEFTQPEPDVNMLLASTFRDSMSGRYFIDVWTRDDATQSWTLVTPHEGP